MKQEKIPDSKMQTLERLFNLLGKTQIDTSTEEKKDVN
jgi:hypothetical protein